MTVPTAPAALPSLATPDDVVGRLGRQLNQLESARVDAMLQDGSAIIRRYARYDFAWHDIETKTFRGDNGTIKLPTRPNTTIEGIVAISGIPGVPNLPVYWYVFDGIDTITIPAPWYSGIVNLPAYWYRMFWMSESFEVTRNYGDVSVPPEVVAVLCAAISSELSTPTQSATLYAESVGSYSYTMRRTSGAGFNAALIDAGMKDVLVDYRQRHGTIHLRP